MPNSKYPLPNVNNPWQWTPNDPDEPWRWTTSYSVRKPDTQIDLSVRREIDDYFTIVVQATIDNATATINKVITASPQVAMQYAESIAYRLWGMILEE